MNLVLASASPRRKELMAVLGLEFQVMAAGVPEDQVSGERAQDMVMRLSLDKASASAGRIKAGLVIGADSTVVLDGEVLGKPADADDARHMLHRLSGTQHQVMTGLSVVNVATGDRQTDWMASGIKLRDLSDAEIDASIRSGTPFDKAGAYAVQDQELCPAEWWRGCYSNIVGLPLCRLLEMLEALGYPLPDREKLRAPSGCTGECPFRMGKYLPDNQSREKQL
ncbi:MAG: septum formation protein Maf [Chloroflexi bacterium]|nr:septum formation protein Maf [Chloroflexota bacterium]